MSVVEPCRKHGISDATFYNRRSKWDGSPEQYKGSTISSVESSAQIGQNLNRLD